MNITAFGSVSPSHDCHTRGWFWESPKLAVGVKSKGGLMWTFPSNFADGVRGFEQTWQPAGLCP